MKKWLCMGLACLLTLCLTACGGAPAASDGAGPTESPDLLDVARGVRARFVEEEPSETDADAAEAVESADAPEVADSGADGGQSPEERGETPVPEVADGAELPESGSYTTAEDVALYLHVYGHLPGNFITKAEARKLGWEGGSLEPYAPGKCIGGDRFGNYEGLLPADRSYQECDIDTLGANSRGAKRLVFSDDGLIYYTADHYNTFVLLYGEA